MDNKNRLKFENLENEEEKYHSEIVEESPYYKEKPKRSFLGLLLWSLFFLIIVGGIGLGVWYAYTHKIDLTRFWPSRPSDVREQEKTLPTPREKEQTSARKYIDQIIEKPYLPQPSLEPELSRCINLYRDRFLKKAFITCEEFLNRPATDAQKSVALTVLGIMFDEAGRYSHSIENLKKAINYDKSNVHAYYNLAMAYKHSGNFPQAKEWAGKAREIAPGDGKIANLAASLMVETNDPQKAIETYKEGMAIQPNNPELAYNLALSQYKQGNVPEAIQNFRKAIVAGGTSKVSELANAHLGTIYFHRGELEAAEHHFRQSINLNPDNARYLYNLGVILKKSGQRAEAISIFEKALQAGSQDTEIYRYIAESFQEMKMTNVAISSLQKALKMKPNDVESMFQLADLHYNRKNLTEAEALFRRIIKATPGDANTESALINLGIVLDELQRYDEAIQAFSRAIEINSKNADAYYNLGISYKKSGQPTLAIQTWRKAVLVEPSNLKNLEAIGDYYMANGFYLEASREYEKIAEKDKNNFRIKLKLADSYLSQKSYGLAEKQLLQVLNYSKEGSEIKLAHRKLALVYSQTGGKNKSKARDEAFRATHMDPADMQSRLVLAKILIDTDSLVDREKAIDELTTIVRSDVSSNIAAKAYNYLGLCYYKNGEFKRAMREFQNAIDLDPTLTEAYDNKRAARASYEDLLSSDI